MTSRSIRRLFTMGFNALRRTALAPVSEGMILAAMTLASAKVSGAHFNPAVTVRLTPKRRFAHNHFEHALKGGSVHKVEILKIELFQVGN